MCINTLARQLIPPSAILEEANRFEYFALVFFCFAFSFFLAFPASPSLLFVLLTALIDEDADVVWRCRC